LSKSEIVSVNQDFDKILLKGKGLFVFSDPGGAKPILSIAKFNLKNLSDCLIISDRLYPFYKEFDLEVENISQSVEEYIDNFQPDFIFTGTSYSSKIELGFLKLAKERKIFSYAYVDHNTSIVERFQIGDQFYFPDKILLKDIHAYDIAVDNGISKKKLMIIGNPFLRFIKKWTPKIDKEEFLSSVGIRNEGKVIVVYAPDPLTNIDWDEKFGFNEIEPTRIVNEVALELKKEYIFIFKPHPNQDLNLISQDIICNMLVADKMADSNLLIYFSDIVIGFFSNFLIEALEFDKKVIRFLPNGIINDPFSQNSNMNIIYTKKNLLYEIVN